MKRRDSKEVALRATRPDVRLRLDNAIAKLDVKNAVDLNHFTETSGTAPF